MNGSTRSISLFAFLLLGAFLIWSCGFDPGSSFEGFDGQGTRIAGQFTNLGTLSSQSSRQSVTTSSGFTIVVYVEGDPDNSTTVDSEGVFILVGLPEGTFTLVFALEDGTIIGEITFTSVDENQEITITVKVNDNGFVVIIEEERDGEPYLGECPRGAGFFCQHQDGSHRSMSAEQFEDLAEAAAVLLVEVAAELLVDFPELSTGELIASAVCDTGDQLLRQLATLALNFAAGLVSPETLLVADEDEEEPPFSTVGQAFFRAVEIASAGLTSDERNDVKDVLDDINNVENIECVEEDEDEDDEDGDDDDNEACDSATGGKVTICHNGHTITVSASAWPAHRGHGDTCGPCE